MEGENLNGLAPGIHGHDSFEEDLVGGGEEIFFGEGFGYFVDRVRMSDHGPYNGAFGIESIERLKLDGVGGLSFCFFG